jgi:hypothetical protein
MTEHEAQIAGPCRICKVGPGEECINPSTGAPLGGVHVFGARRPLEQDFELLIRDKETVILMPYYVWRDINGLPFSSCDEDDCGYCGAPPQYQDPTWDADEDSYVPTGVCARCGADIRPCGPAGGRAA